MNTLKSIGVLATLAICALPTFSQDFQEGMVRDTVKNVDTVIMEDIKTGEKKTVRIHFPGEDNAIISLERSDKSEKIHRESDKKNYSSRSVSRPIFGIVFANMDLGLSKPINNGDFNLTAPNDVLNYRPAKTVNFGFDVLKVGYKVNNHFRVYAAGGFEWNYIRLNQSIDFSSDGTPYEDYVVSADPLKKNRLTSTYLRVPLTFEFRGDHNSAWGRTKVAFGPIAGFLMKGTQRYKDVDGKKVKEKGDYGYAPFQYGAFARFGVGGIGIYGKYYVNDMFNGAPAGSELQNFSFGLTFLL